MFNRESFIDAAIALCDKCIAILDDVLDNDGPQAGLIVVATVEQVPAIEL